MAGQRTLERLWETGEHSDASFICRSGSGQIFNVHKNIIAGSKYFAELHRKAKVNGPIQLDDVEFFAESALRCLYGLEIKYDIDSTDHCLDLVHLSEAADRFEIAGFNDEIEKAIRKYLHEASVTGLVAFGETLYGPEIERDSVTWAIKNEYGSLVWKVAENLLVIYTAQRLRSIMQDGDLWAQICQSPEYLKKVLEYIMAQDSFKFEMT